MALNGCLLFGSIMASSNRRFDDLKNDLVSLKEKIRIQMRRNANDFTLNKLTTDGDRLLQMIRDEVARCPEGTVRADMNNRCRSVENEWAAFRNTVSRPRVSRPRPPADTTQRQLLNQGLQCLEQTSQSLNRAEAAARETEDIGTNILDELGHQRDSLLRTRANLDTNVDSLKQSHRLIRNINGRLITNKCLLIVIILLEVAILAAVIVYRFVLGHHK